MDYVRRNFRIDGLLAEELTEHARKAICSESNVVEVALAHLFAHGYDFVADSVESFNSVDDAELYMSEVVF